jgi:predicted nucleic acid-binding protein
VIAAVLDTTVIVHLLRKFSPAVTWLASQNVTFAITPITWMEVMVGVANKRAQADYLHVLISFEMLHLTSEDQDWAMEQMEQHRLSQGVGVMDCFNASICNRLKIPIYTHNQKDFLKMLSQELVIKPY